MSAKPSENSISNDLTRMILMTPAPLAFPVLTFVIAILMKRGGFFLYEDMPSMAADLILLLLPCVGVLVHGTLMSRAHRRWSHTNPHSKWRILRTFVFAVGSAVVCCYMTFWTFLPFALVT